MSRLLGPLAAGRRLGVVAVAAAVLAVPWLGAEAVGQQSTAPRQSLSGLPADGRASEEMQSIWAKLCGETADPANPGKTVKICTTQFEVLNRDAVPVLGGAVTSIEGQTQELFSVTVPQGPQGIAIRPGVRVRIDDGQALALSYTFCFVHGCLAEIPATKELVDSLKSGRTVVIGLYDTTGRLLSLPVPLEGFGVAYGGPSVDPKRYVELRQKMVEEYRKTLEDESRPAPANAAPPRPRRP